MKTTIDRLRDALAEANRSEQVEPVLREALGDEIYEVTREAGWLD